MARHTKLILFASLAAVWVAGCSGGDSGSSSSSSSGSSTGSGSTGGELGPGAAFKCDSSGKDAWDTYGVTAFVAVNESIFSHVTSEISANGSTNVGDSFSLIGTSGHDDLPAFKGNLAAFLVYAYGGPSSITYTDGVTYTGPQDMVAIHTGMHITSDQYDYFVANVVVPALTDNGVPTGDITSCFAPVVTDAAFKASIVGH